jgi:hypothetical protein
MYTRGAWIARISPAIQTTTQLLTSGLEIRIAIQIAKISLLGFLAIQLGHSSIQGFIHTIYRHEAHSYVTDPPLFFVRAFLERQIIQAA